MPLCVAEVGIGSLSHLGQCGGAFSVTNAGLAEPPGLQALRYPLQ
jgi:hypothetical protein